jgi:ubiquinone/menaquinone biosynthesis C-methylase UbiE
MTFKKHPVEWDEDKVSRFWDFISTSPKLGNQFFGLRNGNHVAEVIDAEIGFRNLSNILDMSCGRGDIIGSCLKYLDTDQRIFGTDYSEKNVNYVNHRFSGEVSFSKAVLSRGFPIGFEDEFFSLIIITEVIEHLTPLEAESLLIEARRLLSPAGYIFITTRNEEDLESNSIMCPDCGCVFHRWQHLQSWGFVSLRNKMEDLLFKTTISKPFIFCSSWKLRWALKMAAKMSLFKPADLLYVGRK